MQLWDPPDKQLQTHCEWLREVAERLGSTSEVGEQLLTSSIFIEQFILPRFARLLALPARPAMLRPLERAE